MNKLRSIYNVIHHSIRSSILDYSLPIVVIIILILNFVSFYTSNLFETTPEDPISFSTIITGVSFTGALIFILYGGYLGSKFYSKEFEDETIHSLFMLPSGRTVVYTGKLIAGFSLLSLVTIVTYIQTYFSLRTWGDISLLTMTWGFNFIFMAFICGLFVFLLSIIVSIVTKKVLSTMLFVLAYTIFTFAMGFFEADKLVYDVKTYLMLIAFPFRALTYMDYCIIHHCIIDYTLIYVPLLGVAITLGLSYLMIREVNV